LNTCSSVTLLLVVTLTSTTFTFVVIFCEKRIGIFFWGCIFPKIRKNIQFCNRKISSPKNFPIFLSKNERICWRKKLLILDLESSISTFLGFKV
jgi:hypothetical protein